MGFSAPQGPPNSPARHHSSRSYGPGPGSQAGSGSPHRSHQAASNALTRTADTLSPSHDHQQQQHPSPQHHPSHHPLHDDDDDSEERAVTFSSASYHAHFQLAGLQLGLDSDSDSPPARAPIGTGRPAAFAPNNLNALRLGVGGNNVNLPRSPRKDTPRLLFSGYSAGASGTQAREVSAVQPEYREQLPPVPDQVFQGLS